jgi:hypothetical protein
MSRAGFWAIRALAPRRRIGDNQRRQTPGRGARTAADDPSAGSVCRRGPLFEFPRAPPPRQLCFWEGSMRRAGLCSRLTPALRDARTPVIRPAKAARQVRFGDVCRSWQRPISTDCAPSPVKSSILLPRCRESKAKSGTFRCMSKDAFARVDRDYVAAFAALGRAAGASHFGLVSAVGADARSSSFYLRTKGEA